MEMEVIRQEKNLLEFWLRGERHTYPEWLKSTLLAHADVTFAAYSLIHPMDADAKFIVRTKSKDVKKVLLEVIDQMDEELSEFEKTAKKAFK